MISLDRNRNIADILLDIMDRGPRPMKNLKVAEKNRNCVDRFWDAHQSEYEAREKPNNHDVERVNQHNLTYPRLDVELNKRKSLSKIRTILQNNDNCKRQYDVECTAGTELRRFSQLQKNRLKPKCKQRKTKNKTRYRDRNSRVQKNRKKTQKRVKSRLYKTFSINKKTKCLCYYVRVKHKRVGNDVSMNLHGEPKNSRKSCEMPIIELLGSNTRIVNDASKEGINSRGRSDCLFPNERVNDKSEDERSEQSSLKTLNNPDTSVASISTFNTFASLDQEPMVNMEL